MSFETGLSETILTVPVTRGSRMKLRPVCCPIVLITAWMSALTKLTVNLSSPGANAGVAGAGAVAGACASVPVAASARATQPPTMRAFAEVRNFVTI